MYKKRKINGFTLIEILAVIVILGVVAVIAIPSVSEQILESRKATYVSTVSGYVKALKYKINNFEYSFSKTDTTYYVHINNLPLEEGGASPFGEWEQAYVVAIYNGTEHIYYWTSMDSSGYKIPLTKVDEITKDSIIQDKNKIVESTRGIGKREKIVVIGPDGNQTTGDSQLNYTGSEASECYVYEIIDNEVTINSYSNTCSKVVEIPATIEGKPVKKIANYAFANLNLTWVKIPEGVTTIGSGSFRTNKIEKVVFPSTLVSIGSEAFAYNSLTAIAFQSIVSDIGAGAFTDNNIPPENAYIYKQNLNGSVDYSTILGYAGSFTGGGTSTTLVIPGVMDGVALKTISGSAFRNLGLTSVTIPDTVETIGSFAFSGNKLTNIKLPSNLKKIEGAAFASNSLTSLEIPSTVTSLASRSFNNNKLTGDAAFIYKRNSNGSIDYSTIVSYAGSNKNVTIPATMNGVNLTTIASSSFFGCGLKTVTIPNSVTSIGNYAFNANSLSQEQAFIYKRNSDGTIDNTVLIGYGGADRGNSSPVVIPSNVKVIDQLAFGETSLKSVTIPEGVRSINASAFKACYLKEVTIPSTVTYIGSKAFAKEVSWGNFNMMTKIVNKTGKSFDWGSITYSRYSSNIATGTIKHQYGNITLTS